ncbi:MAG TPA: amino acid adenylation domain-containing protein [Burkholderiaceae bacterium]|nr:amino acid adenylation domain-containing protein [Burkholderiaceae bacterium]
MSHTVEPSSGSVPLLDVLPQTSATDTASVSQFRVDLAKDLVPKLKGLADRVGVTVESVAMAAWLVTLDRVRGDATVDLGGARYFVPADEFCLNWLARLKTEAGSQTASSGSARELHWATSEQQLALSHDEIQLCVAFDAQSMAWVATARTPPLSAESVETLLSAAAWVLEQMVTDASQNVLSLAVLRPAEQHQLLQTWNDDPWPYKGPMDVVSCFGLAVRSGPERVAVSMTGHGDMSYQALDDRSSQLAHRLIHAGVTPGSVVAVALERSVDALVAILAVLKAGAAYLPLEHSFPEDRLRFMFDDAQAKLVLTHASLSAKLPASWPRLAVDSPPENGWTPSSELPTIRPDDLAYVMYTSGSTGTPKGVEIPHRAIVRLVCGCRFMALNAETVMLHAAPLGFDASTLEIWGPLLNGGRCVLHTEAIPTGPGLSAVIGQHQVGAAWLTAALFNAVVDDDPRHLGKLKELLIGGEALSVDHVTRFMRAAPQTALINGYGPTECTTFTATHSITTADTARRSIPIGRPITQTPLFVLNRRGEPVPRGVVGELYVGGLGVARGYLRRPELTAERFVSNRFTGGQGLLYRTGDLVRYLADGAVEFIGRADTQVKIRGFRIEPGEIEAVLAANPQVQTCAVIARKDDLRGVELVAYVVASSGSWDPAALHKYLYSHLPDFMVPGMFVRMAALPVTANGKLDRRALPEPVRERPSHLAQDFVEPRNAQEKLVAEVLGRLLGIAQVGAQDNFFDLGGNSLLVMRALAALRERGATSLQVASMFADPTVQGIAKAMAASSTSPEQVDRLRPPLHASDRDEPVAIIGMAGRFPGAATLEEFWALLDEGREAIRYFKADELDASIPAALRADPNYVAARGVIDNVEMFDAGFFGFTSREAELMDPQHRIFLEICWECLERAGHVPEKYDAPIGVFAGMYNATYFQRHVSRHPDKIERLGEFPVMLSNEKDYITTRVAHKLGLTGPAIAVHTACSTSLVAIAQAVDSLRLNHCSMALAGGSSVTCPPNSGYLHVEGSMLSPDGHTRTFDVQAQGTVFSDGAAVVLLKRLSDALADGNPVYAVIRGVGLSNDGADRASFTAPGVDGQASAITAALHRSQVDARSISYVEAHGTATPLGDPIEVAALTKAYRTFTPDQGFCAIGSLKSNVGHLVIAAGAAGVIKTALSLHHERLPKSLHFTAPNPKIGLETSPFVVQHDAAPWPRGPVARRAGVSSFGVGGTNAHAILEEAPLRSSPQQVHGPQLLKLSARSRPALDATVERLAAHLERYPDTPLAEAAHTLEVGRRDFAHRSFVVAADAQQAAQVLRDAAGARQYARQMPASKPKRLFMFPGQGAQYAGMGSGVYEALPECREAMDRCFSALAGVTEIDLRSKMFGNDPAALMQTEVTQPATFCLEYALASAWLARGLMPDALIGHSVGEFVAATFAGVMSLEDAIRLVAKRGALMQALPAGGMLSVRLSAAELEPMLPPGLQLAAENGPKACVVAGPNDAVDAFEKELSARDVSARRLQTSHAFHSAMMDPAVPVFEHAVRAIRLAAPTIPIVSTVTGDWLTPEQATDPGYWAQHLRKPVRFAPAVATALTKDAPLFIECGPRNTLSTLVRQHKVDKLPAQAIATLADEAALEHESFVRAAGQLWTYGLNVPWRAGESPTLQRIQLPTYPFERQRHWVDATSVAPAPVSMQPSVQPSSQPTSPAILHTTLTEAPSMSIATPADRRPALQQRLRALFEDISGEELGDVDPSASFVELGFDSLTLTQIALKLKNEFALPITFRQLMSSEPNFDALTAFLDDKLAKEVAAVAAQAPVAAAQQATVSAAVSVAVPVMPALPAMPLLPAGGGASPVVQQIIAQQMQLMAQQLALLQGAAVAPMDVAPPAASGSGVAAAVAPTASVSPAAEAAPAATPAAPAADDSAALAHTTYDVKKAFGAIARIHTGKVGITPVQQARLDAFIRRYNAKTKGSKQFTQDNRGVMSDPRAVTGFRPGIKELIYPIVVNRSKGAHIWDVDGNEYVDSLCGFGPNMLGWQPDFVVDALKAQIDQGFEIGPQHPLQAEVARQICEMTGSERAAFCNTGSEAVMGCTRIARTVTGRSLIAIFTGGYHGIFDEVLVRGTKKLKTVPAAPGIMPEGVQNVLVLDYGTPESLEILKSRANELAAIMVEPVQSRRPDFQPKEFLQACRQICDDSGALLIFDEVVTGFRACPGGAQEHFGIRADIASYGKVLGGGLPIGAIAGKAKFMDALDGGYWEFGDDSTPPVGVTYFAGTFVRHPLALAAAHAVLKHLKEKGPALQSELNEKTARFVAGLNQIAKELNAPITVKTFASLWRATWNEDQPFGDLLFHMMRDKGVHLYDGFPCFFTTAHSEADIAQITRAFRESLLELAEGGFIHGFSAPASQSVALDANSPPVPGARLGRDESGQPAWYVPNPDSPGKYVKLEQTS